MSEDSFSDPFDDLEALRVSPLEDLTAEKILSTVPVRKPGTEEFFRVHPKPEFTDDLLLLESSVSGNREIYIVVRSMLAALGSKVRPYRLYTCMSKWALTFLWPIKLPHGSGGQGKSWSSSALAASTRAMEVWVRLESNMKLGAYEHIEAAGDLGEPQWPDKTFVELMRIAFADRIISDDDHPVVRGLAGLE